MEFKLLKNYFLSVKFGETVTCKFFYMLCFWGMLCFHTLVPRKVVAQSISVSGASRFEQDEETKTNLRIYAGYALPDQCTAGTRDNVSPCNSCNGFMITSGGKTFPAPCNERSIYQTLVVSISVNSEKSDINGLDVGISQGGTYADNPISSGITTEKVSGKTYTISATWSDLVTALSGNSEGLSSGTLNITDCTSKCGAIKTFYFGPIKDNAYTEKIAVTLNLSYVDYDSANESAKDWRLRTTANFCTPTPGTITSSFSSVGLCYFEIFPGDEKAYINNLIPGWSSTPKDPDSQLNFTHVEMFYAEKNISSSSLQTLQTVTNASGKSELAITDKAEDPLEDYKVTGLENGKNYCFLPALKDVTGNIQYFLDFTNFANDSNSQFTDGFADKMCGAPDEVIGVLGDKNCFIATATFGSSIHPYIQVLRSFRDQFLRQFSLGKSFIRWYYKNGPEGAIWIRKNSYIKPLVRIILLPIIGICYLILNPVEMIYFLLGVVLFVFIYRFFWRKNKFSSTTQVYKQR